MNQIQCDVNGLSHVGQKRKRNEDSFLVARLHKAIEVVASNLPKDEHAPTLGESEGDLLIIADGMGGHISGDVASQLAVKTINHYLHRTMTWFYSSQAEAGQIEDVLVDAVRQCQEVMEEQLEKSQDTSGMGTTITLAYINWPDLYVVHVGDSRCYLKRGDEFNQITRDDTFGQEMIDRGVMDEEDLERSPMSHVLSQAIVAKEDAEITPRTYRATLSPGDSLILCSDGLSGQVEDDRMDEIVQRAESAEQACQNLVEAANEAGGDDNITVIVSHYMEA